jgi:hypothetical protein
LNSKVQIVAPTPVSFDPGTDLSAWNIWSGREDSNLRPLPPEGAAPSLRPWFSVVGSPRQGALAGVCSRLIHGARFMRHLGALSFPPLASGRAAVGEG